jgi:hypothetical protein
MTYYLLNEVIKNLKSVGITLKIEFNGRIMYINIPDPSKPKLVLDFSCVLKRYYFYFTGQSSSNNTYLNNKQDLIDKPKEVANKIKELFETFIED